MSDNPKAFASLQQKALHAHLATLNISISGQVAEIKEMEAFDPACIRKPKSNLLASSEKLTKCILLYMHGSTPITSMHLAVVSRLSESYRLEEC